MPTPGEKLAEAIALLDAITPHADLGGNVPGTPFIDAMQKAHDKAMEEAQRAAEEYAP